MLARHAPPLVVTADGPAGYSLDLPTDDLPPPRRFVGAVRMGRRYVSFHLMPVYAFPDLLDGISPELRRRMQGKSCFNFTAVDEVLLGELEGLTTASIARYRRDGVKFLAGLGR